MPSHLSLWKLGLLSARFHWRTHISVLLGTLLSGASLVGALLVGDSVRYSLRAFALGGLGNTHIAMNTRQRYFHTALADGMRERLSATITPVLMAEGMAMHQSEGAGPTQVNRVHVLGVEHGFWDLSPGFNLQLGETDIALSRKLAAALGVEQGDEVSIRVGQPSLMPRDAPLASRSQRLSQRGSFTVREIVADDRMGRFSLQADQVAPHNAFVNLSWLQERIGLAGKANLLLIGTGAGGAPSLDAADKALSSAWDLGHAGIRLREISDRGIIQLESERIFLDPETAATALSVAGAGADQGVGVLTYLVNAIRSGEGEEAKMTPYSFVVASSPCADSNISPVPAGMKDDQIILNRWTAGQLSVSQGDVVTMEYFHLSASGGFEAKSRRFRVYGVVDMSALETERELMPVFPGLTDVDTCREWDIGMPMDDRMLEDEANQEYWDLYRATPKAAVTLAAGRDMWANHFGDLSAARYPLTPGAHKVLLQELTRRIDPASLGFFLVPIREQVLQAVSEAEDLSMYFLGMSFFLIIAALMLTGLLFVFGVQQRAAETGTLLAIGFRPRHVRELFLWEGGALALIGSVAGAMLATLYTRALIRGLAWFRDGAAAGSAIGYHAEPATFLKGAAATALCAVLAIAIAVWRQARRPARELLYEDLTQEMGTRRTRRRPPRVAAVLAVAGLMGAAATVGYAVASGSENMAHDFFSAGSMLLVAGLAGGALLLRRMEKAAGAKLTIRSMGVRNAARRRGRSLTAMGLLACGSFLVFATAAMREDLEGNARRRWSGTGGFALFGEATLPLPDPPESAKGRKVLNLDADKNLDGVRFVSMKVRNGDDASCFNLNQARTPRLIGVDPGAFMSPEAFAREGEGRALWGLLREPLPDGMVPGIVGDADTATYRLKAKVGPVRGDILTYRDELGKVVNVKLVGKLPMRLSVFQGTVLIPADAFAVHFPSESGYRMFVVDVPSGAEANVRQLLSRRLARLGVDVVPSTQRLEEFYTVETTYLGMFVVLGGLGLLLGTIGMGVVVLRNVMERRSELAMLRCVGFSRSQVASLIVAEHWMLLLAGVLVGAVSSFLAVLPALLAPGVRVPYVSILLIFAAVLLLGLAWTKVAADLAVRKSLVAALRNE